MRWAPVGSSPPLTIKISYNDLNNWKNSHRPLLDGGQGKPIRCQPHTCLDTDREPNDSPPRQCSRTLCDDSPHEVYPFEGLPTNYSERSYEPPLVPAPACTPSRSSGSLEQYALAADAVEQPHRASSIAMRSLEPTITNRAKDAVEQPAMASTVTTGSLEPPSSRTVTTVQQTALKSDVTTGSVTQTSNAIDTQPSGAHNSSSLGGLLAPSLNSARAVTGATTPRLRIENKHRRVRLQSSQPSVSYWTTHAGQAHLPATMAAPAAYRNNMCPTGVALHHPAAPILLKYASGGCPTLTGQPWTPRQMQAAIDNGPHISAMVPAAMKQLDEEIREKVKNGQAKLVRWDDIKHDPPTQLKVSPVAMVPHKSRPFRAILDLSFSVRLSPTDSIPSVNSTTVKTAPRGAISQIGHVLHRIIHAFAETNETDKIFMAKWDIKDGFWRLDCEAGEEWNFSYVLPSSVGGSIVLVVPTSLQMGWIESPPYFCAASETARDVAAHHAELPMHTLPDHQFLHLTSTNPTFSTLPLTSPSTDLRYMLEVYVDDFIGLAIAPSQQHLNHLATAMMSGIHSVFPPSQLPETDPISYKKLLKGDGEWSNAKEILGLMFDGTEKTIWLSHDKRDALLQTLRTWTRLASKRGGIPFSQFRSTLAKLQHAFLTIPAGRGLFSPFYMIMALQPSFVFLHRNIHLLLAVKDCRTFLRDSVGTPTKCRNLVSGWPD